MVLKWCYACKKDKDLERDFARNNAQRDGHSNMCKACKKTYNAAYYQENKARDNPGRAENRRLARQRAREKVIGYLKTHPCVDCGETDIVVLEFDHQDDKLKDVNLMVRDGAPWRRILAEIIKCEVVCANDHRRRTARMFGYYRTLAV
jgi:hypothetical protein